MIATFTLTGRILDKNLEPVEGANPTPLES